MVETTTSLLILLCGIITALCCMSFYLFRSITTRQKEYQEMDKAVKSAVEVVLSLSEKGVPIITNKVNDVEHRIKMVEQNIKKMDNPPRKTQVEPTDEDDAIKAARANRRKMEISD